MRREQVGAGRREDSEKWWSKQEERREECTALDIPGSVVRCRVWVQGWCTGHMPSVRPRQDQRWVTNHVQRGPERQLSAQPHRQGPCEWWQCPPELSFLLENRSGVPEFLARVSGEGLQDSHLDQAGWGWEGLGHLSQSCTCNVHTVF